MTDLKPLLEIKKAVLVLVLFMVMVGTGEGEPWLSNDDGAGHYQIEAQETNFEETGADGEPRQLAMNGAGEEERQQLRELLSVLDEETAVATKTKMNNDYVPGMVTVMHGEQLEALGVRTVVEALSMVPGIQAARLGTGEPTVKVRGVAFPFNAGNIKVMLNSIALSRESSGINSSVLLTPIAQVDRIEVIRGPGSSIYGDFAMAGVVNIITKDTGGRLFGFAGDDESLGGGGHYSYRDDARDLTIGVNMSTMDNGDNAAALDRNPDEKRHTGVFSFNYKDFSFTAEGVQRRIELQRLPQSERRPPPPGPGPGAASEDTLRKEESWALEGRQAVELGGNLSLDAYLSYLQNSFDADEPLTGFQGDRVETGIDLNWSPWAGHQVLFSASYADSHIDDAFQKEPSGADRFQVSGVDRSNYSLGLQDQVALNERFSMTLGLRYDDYDDVGSRMTPRVAAVYRLGEHHVVKAQYSEGFRAPTFWELYGTGTADESLDFEVMDTTELSYIYRRPNAAGRVTLYYSEIDDGLFGSHDDGFSNSVNIESKGVEVELEQRFGETFRWQANLSYNDTRDGRYPSGDYESIGISAWLGNLAFFLQPVPKLVLTGRLLHVGDRYGSDGRIEGYDTVDFTVSRMDLWKAGLTLRLGIKNILDDEIVYILQKPIGFEEAEYCGRTWWLQLSYDF